VVEPDTSRLSPPFRVVLMQAPPAALEAYDET
jgi:hypothetical protein